MFVSIGTVSLHEAVPGVAIQASSTDTGVPVSFSDFHVAFSHQSLIAFSLGQPVHPTGYVEMQQARKKSWLVYSQAVLDFSGATPVVSQGELAVTRG